MAGYAVADRAQELGSVMKAVAETVKPWLAKAIEPLTRRLDELESAQSSGSLAKDDAIIDLRSRLDAQARQIETQAREIETLRVEARAAPAPADLAALGVRLDAQAKTIGDLESRAVPGANGKNGTAGVNGERGTDGEHGIDGAPGVAGARGADGAPGKDGISVMDAAIDADGLLLLTLSDGTAKRVGKVRGDIGSAGDRGEKGDQGPVGERGEAGPIGERGEKGDLGERGQKGELGPSGERGEKGEHGEFGLRGECGPIGEKGEQGAQGEKGEIGLIGKAGDNGRAGNDGVGGKDGASAVDIARIYGFTGSDLDWLTSLRGKDGTNAVNGKDGRSAFEIAHEHGFSGSALDWLTSLRGKDATNGRDGVSILSAVVDGEGELVLTASDGARHRAGIVRGKDGTAGINGTRGEPGSAGRDAVAIRPIAMIEEERSYPAGTFAHHAGGSWYAERSTDALKGSRPQDCGWYPIAIGEQSFSIELADDGRTIVTKRKTSTGLLLERRFKLPTVIDRRIYTASKTYDQGDAVTRGGQYYVANVDNPKGTPGDDSGDWRILIKGAKV